MCLILDKADRQVTNKGRLGRIRSLIVLAALSEHRERASSGYMPLLVLDEGMAVRSQVNVRPVTYHLLLLGEGVVVWHLFAIATSEIRRIIY